MTENTSIIIQARTGSTRLPNKMVKLFYNEESLLEIIISRLKESKLPIIVATTTNTADNIIEDIAVSKNVKIFRGDENDVLKRFIDAAEHFGADKIIRVCADNPLLDIEAIKFLHQNFIESNVDYWCFATNEGIPTIKTHYGFWCEGVALLALKNVEKLTNEPLFREHVTNFIYSNPKHFTIDKKAINVEIEELKLRLTIDTLADFELMQEIYSQLIKNSIPLHAFEISSFVSQNKHWLQIMNQEIILNSK